jgi:hypothetical protein
LIDYCYIALFDKNNKVRLIVLDKEHGSDKAGTVYTYGDLELHVVNPKNEHKSVSLLFTGLDAKEVDFVPVSYLFSEEYKPDERSSSSSSLNPDVNPSSSEEHKSSSGSADENKHEKMEKNGSKAVWITFLVVLLILGFAGAGYWFMKKR